jgi:hypothetical protein
MDNFKTLKETEELVNDSKNRYKITIELATLAKKHAYEFKNISASNLAAMEKPILIGLTQMINESS